MGPQVHNPTHHTRYRNTGTLLMHTPRYGNTGIQPHPQQSVGPQVYYPTYPQQCGTTGIQPHPPTARYGNTGIQSHPPTARYGNTGIQSHPPTARYASTQVYNSTHPQQGMLVPEVYNTKTTKSANICSMLGAFCTEKGDNGSGVLHLLHPGPTCLSAPLVPQQQVDRRNTHTLKY